jgi:hypothetical protein
VSITLFVLEDDLSLLLIGLADSLLKVSIKFKGTDFLAVEIEETSLIV